MPSNSPRSLDRIVRTLLSLIRSYRLPRPDRLVVSTSSGSVHAEFSSGTAPDRLAALLLWVTRLDGVRLTWTLRPDRTLTVAATARNGSGLVFGLTASAAVADLGGVPAGDVGSGLVVLAGVFRVAPMVVEPVTFEEVARLVHVGRAVVRPRQAASGAVAA
ncbi:hypothetical protein ABZ816_11520 [Actinosynnema sp. NPDC047251]|uniref:Uncharacterized protein n=1 Tax=Saccharothrix espanaensis (strain ATCC 51144 / DSM 44229 / JCM 9112 / NBRC 15066 / NRRL 15764) TaxID=1179773 RepID=K0K4N4_SACES|nr:hypothetical protein [Saccharothrix espanaensis]CCH35225.1 hypothetical protein BN6_80070 [Saccharothrix espanaensis DSM 44229]